MEKLLYLMPWQVLINSLGIGQELQLKKKKVLFISSTGGHFSELMQLKPLFEKYDHHIITEKDKMTQNLKKKYNNKISYLIYGTRSHIFKYIFIN